ncbi:CDP-diacylglycerol--glycerol-3-phosphate 3-phosphatidyltransferase [Caminicella sporogenes DSM 14501]|uniref:CDP-diacylglycerol--glycerol-3-phosphate 3-phosphatidyltransferase n=1 Tax=Caminicella sporogenes DSM 14501 TaxID=1121266 RepID=A0A1M6L6V4_9FIRM|nr:CDP-diacylglycerol--glycerol-3-phosphate 3-phosphatidyltransferase [Caminicella sporogenes]RKD27726.1 CDP-diacylglycerol--glycerol-3-phosphate 3-phosphatidyltransferase [Caminicella sporogenes]WIF94696.1 CDP-diacylglycerol--glycerol-3-phosphate 3-phosphatidyltransferase [Caminicella sporogenes]SHJ66910.1 CDP-diacylglycerol--glycerol-3-phosphate 3-phosphatidyltransferase [Caminicella sporogenes DSM 14501]
MNLANKLTIARIFLIPIFMVFLLSKIPYGITIAALIFILAALTDSLDGYIARSRNQITKLGKFMDPLADKLLVTAALVSFVQMGKLPAWVVVIIISREFTISVFRAIAAAEGIVIAASPWGKAKTISQIVMIISILFNNYPFSLINLPFNTIATWIAVILTIISGVDYIYVNKKVLRQ